MSLEEVRRPTFSRDLAPPLTHPLVRDAVDFLAGRTGRPTVLLLGIGNGRHVPPLLASGALVLAADDDARRLDAARDRFASEPAFATCGAGAADLPGVDAVVSTHALLHGTHGSLALTVAMLRAGMRPAARLFATFGSRRDPRCGAGTRVADGSYAPDAGPEAGVAHAFFDGPELRSLLTGFAPVDATETSAGDVVGRWTHGDGDATSIVHWFVRATRPEPGA